MVTLFFYVIVPLGGDSLPDGALPRRPCQEHFRISAPASHIFQMAFRHGAPASHIFPMAFRHGAPTSNKPHLAEKSTPVWLAIWRTWAGFANSQLLPDAAAAAPCRALRAESPAERQLFRTDFRFAPSLLQCCAGTSDSVLHWVSDSALHRVFDSALHWVSAGRQPHLAPLTLCCIGAPAGRQPHLAEKNSGLASNLAHLGRIC